MYTHRDLLHTCITERDREREALSGRGRETEIDRGQKQTHKDEDKKLHFPLARSEF